MFRPTARQTASGTSYRDIAAILESFPATIAYLDTDLVYRFVNSQYEQLFDCPCAEIVGKHVSAVLGESGYAIAGPRLRHALGGELYSYDAEFRFPGRPPCWLAVHYIPDHHPDGSARALRLRRGHQPPATGGTGSPAGRGEVPDALRERPGRDQLL